MSRTTYFGKHTLPDCDWDEVRLDISSQKNLSGVMTQIGHTLFGTSRIITHQDAFLDLFKEYCAEREQDTLLVIKGYLAVTQRSLEAGFASHEMLSIAIERHYAILRKNRNVPVDDRFELNSDVRIALLLI